MTTGLTIALSPERLAEGSAEERAAFGVFAIRAGAATLTEGFDHYINALRPGPLVSGYHVAEWFAWNWWRLRWEPRTSRSDWHLAHKMVSIGEGYIWPNITIFSDGIRTALIADASERPDAKPFRYIGAWPSVVLSSRFEEALDSFMTQILARLDGEGVKNSNLHKLWDDVCAERRDPQRARWRKIEALLGFDPDYGDEPAVERLIADSEVLGEGATNELAADRGSHGGAVLFGDVLRSQARQAGYQASPRDAVRLEPRTLLPRKTEVPAWRIGAKAAAALREQQKLGDFPLNNGELAELAGVERRALEEREAGSSIAFVLKDSPNDARVVLRSKWATGRRFELARLLGDRLLNPSDGLLSPATHARTYRQQMQRSFAAELLSPFEAVEEQLSGDYSPESQRDVAENFNVSERTIETLLMNHGRIPRPDPEEALDAAA